MKGTIAKKMCYRVLLEKGISTKQEFSEKASLGSLDLKIERK
jgi:hypothetical protein